MKKILFLVAACVVAASAQATASEARIRMLASTCYNCHGPDGTSSGAVPSLAGQEKSHLLQAMMECKTGERATTVMQKYMLGYSDEEIAQLADYFANMKQAN